MSNTSISMEKEPAIIKVNKKRKYKAADVVILVILLTLTFLSLLPILHVFALSFSGKSAAAAGLVTIFPVDFDITPYTYILQDERFFQAFGVSVNRVLLGGAINLVITVMMAYALSNEREEFKARNIYMWIVVFTMMFSGGLIPTYMVIRSMGLLDTIWALVLPTAVPVFNVIILMNFFRGIPKEIKEAAIMDGAGPWRIMIQLYVPLAMPAIATVTLFSLVNHWNAFFDGLIYMNSLSNVPLQTYIQQLVVQPINDMNIRQEELAKLSERTFNAAKIVVTMLPILVLYPFVMRFFAKGITLGSVKG